MSNKLESITVLRGDGIGPEVVNEAIKVLDAIGEKFGHNFTYDNQLMGAVAIDETGVPLPDETLESCRNTDALLLGAIGHPRFDNDPSSTVRPEQGLLKLRKELGLFANVRPLRIFESLKHLSVLKPEQLDGVDMVIYRELTGGIYFGEKNKTDDSASDLCLYHRYEIERIAKLAFEAATQRRNKLCLIDKANVLNSSRLWREVVQNMASDYPSVELSYMFVDNAAMQMILYPAQFDVIVTSNMFGDIISDEASILGGSLGLLPSSSAGAKARMYEPCHGSYPQAAGKNIANPLATILSVEMMLRDFDLIKEADSIRDAAEFVVNNRILTQDLVKENAVSCSELGDAMVSKIKE
ncbi:3-isopropylmalate dehydrogenase [Saprospiraceae bacterium]|nr:3-isopropylmalate dehydrogenase [Saprospiraceae bacterium]